MTKAFSGRLWLPLVLFILVISCGKKSNPVGAPDVDVDPPVVEPDPVNVTFEVIQADYQPGEFVQFNVENTTLTEETYTFFGNDSVEFEMASFEDTLGGQHLLYLVSELPPEEYDISFEAIGSESVLSMMINEYEEIPDPKTYVETAGTEVVNILDDIILESDDQVFSDTLEAVKQRLQSQLGEVGQMTEEEQKTLARIINRILETQQQQKQKTVYEEPLNCPDAKTIFRDQLRTTVKLAAVLGSVTYVSALANPLIGLVAGTFSIALIHRDLRILWDMTWDFIDLCIVPEVTILNRSKAAVNAIYFNEFEPTTFSYDQSYSVDSEFESLLTEFQELLNEVQKYIPESFSTLPDDEELGLNRPVDLGEDFIEFFPSVRFSQIQYPVRINAYTSTDSTITMSWKFNNVDLLPSQAIDFTFDLNAQFTDRQEVLFSDIQGYLRIPDYTFPEEIIYDVNTGELFSDTLEVKYVRINNLDFEQSFFDFDYTQLANGDYEFDFTTPYELTDQPVTITWRDSLYRELPDNATPGSTSLIFTTTAEQVPIAERNITWRRGNKTFDWSDMEQFFYKPIYHTLGIRDAAAYEIVTPPVYGEFQFYAGPDGSYKYTPDPNFAGFDSLTYRITNSQGSDEATLIFDMYNVPLLNEDIIGTWRFYIGTYQNSPYAGSTPECSQRETHDPLTLIAFDPFSMNDPVYVEYSEAYQLGEFNADETLTVQVRDCAGNITNEYTHPWFINGDEQGDPDQNPDDGDRKNLFWLQYGETRFPIREAKTELNITFRQSNTFIKMVKVQ